MSSWFIQLKEMKPITDRWSQRVHLSLEFLGMIEKNHDCDGCDGWSMEEDMEEGQQFNIRRHAGG